MTTKTVNPTEAMKSIETAVASGKEHFEKLARTSSEAAQKSYEQVMAVSQENFQKASDAALKSYDEMAALNQQNVDALIKASSIFAKGAEELSKAAMAFQKDSLNSSVELAKKFATCKDPNELVAMQTRYSKDSYEKLISEARKMSEMSSKVANEALAPIQDRINVNLSKIAKPVAA